MEAKIKARLAEYELTEQDLTTEEMEELKEEIAAEERGETVLDSVLDNPSLFYRKNLK